MSARFRYLLALAAGMLLAACASGAASEAASEAASAIVVVVRNDLSPPVPITVYALPTAGVRRRLGMVQGASQDSLEMVPVTMTGTYVLEAEPLGARAIRSNTFTVMEETGLVEWILATNIVTVR